MAELEPLEIEDRPPEELDADFTREVFTREAFRKALLNYDEGVERFTFAPSTKELLSSFTVACLIFNRTIASGIFVQPGNVALGMNSAGNALLLWVFSGVIAICIAVCWLELGLTIPRYAIKGRNGWTKVSAPCGGGDKNYLEYIYKRPKFLMTCIFGILFILLGNLAGNAIQFGVYLLRIHDPHFDANSTEHSGKAIGIAIAAVSACALLNIFSRKGAIRINNCLAIAKVIMLIVIIILGANKRREMGTCSSNFKVQGGKAGFGDIATSMVYAIYPYGGFEQPFYVLSEVSRPRKKFPTAVIAAMVAILIMYPLVHFSYFCVVDLDQFDGSADIFTVFIRTISNGDEKKVEAASAIIAIFIFGNLFVQTYTAARVKQEIAKEGILPFSLFLAAQNASPWAWVKRRFRSTATQPTASQPTAVPMEHHEEEIPIVATLLHWTSYAVSFIAVSWLSPNAAYKYLSFLHSYVFVFLCGSLTGGGLLFLQLTSLINPNCGRKWARKVVWTTWLGPLPALVYFGTSVFLVFACFAPVHNFATVLTGKHWIATLVGLTSILWGVAWWLGLNLIQWMGRWILEVVRTPYLEMNEDGDHVRRSERIKVRHVIASDD